MEAGQAAQSGSGTTWKAAAREEAGFAELVHTHQSMVYSLCWHFFRNRGLAEEIAQDVFLQLFRNLDSIESPQHLEAWLRRTASNRCIDHYRKRGRQGEVPLDGLAEPAAPARTADPMMIGMVRKLVASLPDVQRMVVVLRYQEDLDATEIAAALGMPIQTVWSHLRRAIAMLQEKAGRWTSSAPKEEN